MEVIAARSLLPLVPGCRVRLSGLTGRTDFNGVEADVLDWVSSVPSVGEEDARWVVACGSAGEVKVRARNMTVIGGWPASADDYGLQDCEQAKQQFGLPLITSLDLSRRSISKQHVALISASCDRLASLTLDGCASAVDDESVALLPSLLSLTALSLRDCLTLTDKGIGLLAAGLDLMPEESAEVRNHERSRGIFAALAVAMGGAHRPMQLTSLALAGCAALTDECLRRLAMGCAGLTALELGGCVLVSDRGVCELARNERITALDVSCCPLVTDTGVCALARACPLRSLRLGGAPPGGVLRGLTPFAARVLAEECGPTTLTALDLGGHAQLAADAAVAALCGRCPRLQHLRLTGCERLSADGLRAAIGRGGGSRLLPGLVSLGVGGCPLVNVEDMALLCPGLTLTDGWLSDGRVIAMEE